MVTGVTPTETHNARRIQGQSVTLLSLQSLQVGRRFKQVPLVLAASFLAFIDLFRLGRVYTSRCFGYTIVDLFSLVKLPVVFDLVRTTGPIRSRSLQVSLFSFPPTRPNSDCLDLRNRSSQCRFCKRICAT